MADAMFHRNMEATSAADETRVVEFAFAAPVGDNPGTSHKTVKIVLTAFPGEDAHAHEGERDPQTRNSHTLSIVSDTRVIMTRATRLTRTW